MSSISFSTKYLFEKHKNMAKKAIKMNEAQLRKLVKESINEIGFAKNRRFATTTVTDPVGYHYTFREAAANIVKNGFSPKYIGKNGQMLGPGIYFYTEPHMYDQYGNIEIKAKITGTYPATEWDGGTMFVVPIEDLDKIEIISAKEKHGYGPEHSVKDGKKQHEINQMYRQYGNRSVGGVNGVDDADDYYDLNKNSGSLAMQAMEKPDDYTSSVYRDNGRDSRWASPKGDFSTKRISESQLRKMVAMSVKKALNEVYSLALTDDPFMSNLAEYASKEVLSYTEKWMKQDTRQFQDMSFTAERVYGMLNALAKRIVEAATDLHNGSGNVVSPLKESGDTRRGSYMKGRTIGRRLAKGDASTVKKDNLGNFSEMGELGMKDQYDYENAVKNGGIFGNPFKADEKLQDIQDRYDRLKHDDKFFGDWDKAINSNEQSI